MNPNNDNRKNILGQLSKDASSERRRIVENLPDETLNEIGRYLRKSWLHQLSDGCQIFGIAVSDGLERITFPFARAVEFAEDALVAISDKLDGPVLALLEERPLRPGEAMLDKLIFNTGREFVSINEDY